MNSQVILSVKRNTKRQNNLKLITKLNNYIVNIKKDEIAITAIYIVLGSAIASLTAALSVRSQVNLFILITCTTLAMATNTSVLSQQSFKISTWLFLLNIVVNSILLIYQMSLIIF